MVFLLMLASLLFHFPDIADVSPELTEDVPIVAGVFAVACLCCNECCMIKMSHQANIFSKRIFIPLLHFKPNISKQIEANILERIEVIFENE